MSGGSGAIRRWIILVLALLGLGVSGYLLYEHYVGHIVCLDSGCSVVDLSPYSETFGIPLSIFGLGAYFLIILLSIGALASSEREESMMELGLFGVALGGTFFSAYLTYVELAMIHAVCTWCASSAILVTLITILAIFGLRRGGPAYRASEPEVQYVSNPAEDPVAEPEQDPTQERI